MKKFKKGDLVAVKAPWTMKTEIDRLGFPRIRNNTSGFNTFNGIIIDAVPSRDLADGGRFPAWRVQTMDGHVHWYNEKHIKLLAKA